MESYAIPTGSAKMPIVRGEENMPMLISSKFAKHTNVIAVLTAATCGFFLGGLVIDTSCADGPIFFCTDYIQIKCVPPPRNIVESSSIILSCCMEVSA